MSEPAPSPAERCAWRRLVLKDPQSETNPYCTCHMEPPGYCRRHGTKPTPPSPAERCATGHTFDDIEQTVCACRRVTRLPLQPAPQPEAVSEVRLGCPHCKCSCVACGPCGEEQKP